MLDAKDVAVLIEFLLKDLSRHIGKLSQEFDIVLFMSAVMQAGRLEGLAAATSNLQLVARSRQLTDAVMDLMVQDARRSALEEEMEGSPEFQEMMESLRNTPDHLKN